MQAWEAAILSGKSFLGVCSGSHSNLKEIHVHVILRIVEL
jgi:hypothetical protein